MTNAPPFLIQQLAKNRPSRGDFESDTILMMFMAYVDTLNITLYPEQEEAILELLAYHHVILNTPTGSGKSTVALALHFQALAENRVSCYTAPTKALVNEKFFSLCNQLGATNVGLLTGDARVNADAPVLCCTAEVLSNMALQNDPLDIDYVIMDEFHYYGDKERGVAWQIPLITLKDTVFLLMSATLGDTRQIVSHLEEFTERPVIEVKNTVRPVPLTFEYSETTIHETVERLVRIDCTPVYLVNFTQRDCSEQAQNLMSINVTSKDEKKRIAAELADVRFDTPYGKEFSRFIRHGIGVHHAGMLPKYRRVVERLSQQGLVKVISGTDTLGVGVNIPIRCVLLRQLYKYDGEKTAIISARQFHQICGRAGRKGFDDHGAVVVQAPEWVIENKKREQKIAKNPNLKKKLRKASPPPRSIPWDKSTMETLIGKAPEPLTPRFDVSHGMLISLLQGAADTPGGGYRRLIALIRRSHGTDNDKSHCRKRAAQLLQSLRQAGIVVLDTPHQRETRRILLTDNLQRDFSLHYSLSLYLVQTITLLEDNEERPLDMLTLVEAIMENPNAVLIKQLNDIKSELIQRLKAEGVPYEERMEKLEKVEYPKPLETFIHETFIAFSQSHPWVGHDHIRPKNIAREMYENCYDFNYYVQQLGLARSEGVLLRYLSSVYKIAVQSIPRQHWTEDFEDILAFLHQIVSKVDATLIEEWSLLMNTPISTKDTDNRNDPSSISMDPRALNARLRSEMHLLLSAIGKRNYHQAWDSIYHEGTYAPSPENIETMAIPMLQELETLDLSPRARLSHNTVIKKTAHRRWTVHQKIIGTNGNEDWGIECQVDLTSPRDESLPLVELVDIN